ncbi:MAG: TonB-dependent receptor plug domain-containing protein [Pseudobdellovibrionaceae bacterium]|nr:TonB-dependent receptor plug domain-containing protein [Pseudobdellovibrionaceae bacterium]
MSEGVWGQSQAFELRTIEVNQSRETPSLLPVPRNRIDAVELSNRQVFDISRVLKKEGGVHIQEEDGWGLRLNVGIRGMPPHRSRKITFYEDGVPIAPAPYSAPAAYYNPGLNRTESVEVLKGLNSLLWGPNNVAGSIHYQSKSFSNITRGRAQIGLATFNTQRYQGEYYFSSSHNQFILTAEKLSSDGFKIIDGGGNTGFERKDFLIKYRRNMENPSSGVTVKLGYAEEKSQETYLGLSVEDFYQNPRRRYLSSRYDQMEWFHRTVHLMYDLSGKDWFFHGEIYYHDFDRRWNRLNHLKGPGLPSLYDVLKFPEGGNANYYRLLKGELNSTDLGGLLLAQAHNDRSFGSGGLQLTLQHHPSDFGEWSVQSQFRVRYHEDYIKRNHEFQDWEVFQGNIYPMGTRYDGVKNRDHSSAFSWALRSEWARGDWVFSGAIRGEDVRYQSRDDVTHLAQHRRDHVLVPGIGVGYSFSEKWKTAFQIYRGVTLVGPQGGETTEPEQSWNKEVNLLYEDHDRKRRADITFFQIDYQNMFGICQLNSGCVQDAQLDQTFKGGNAVIEGWEGSWFQDVQEGVTLGFSFTFLSARFRNSFLSTNPEWGVGWVQEGDPFPYVPDWSWAIQLGWKGRFWHHEGIWQYTGRQYDQSVQTDRLRLPAYQVFDYVGSFGKRSHRLVWRIDNVFNHVYMVSFRPFGARPGKPQMFHLGYQWSF